MNILTTVTFEHDSGLPEDRVINTFAWTAPDMATLQAFTTAGIPSFYNTVHAPGADPLAFWMSPRLNNGANVTKVQYYDVTTHLDGSSHGSPIATETFTLGASAAANTLPEECAAVISFHGALPLGPEEVGTTRPAARHRGRVFIGPLNIQGVTTDGHISTPMLNSMHGAGLFMLSSVGAFLSIWSRKNAQMITATGGFADNAFDTQRRRGVKATTRQTW